MTKEEVERLLRHGAYDIFNEDKNGSADAESNDFVQQDIDSILERRSKTVIHDQTGSNSNAAGGTFSKASFKAPKMPASGQEKAQADDIDIDDPEFWKKMVGEAKVDADDLIASGKKRKRSEALYSETAYDKKFDGTLFLSGSDSSGDSDSDSDEWSVQDAGSESLASSDKSAEGGSGQAAKKLVKKKKERAKWGGSKWNQWDKTDATKLLKALQMYGYGNLAWDEFVAKASIDMTNLDVEEVRSVDDQVEPSTLHLLVPC
jgi:chromodomain-helicase-DNA-binding protein 7